MKTYPNLVIGVLIVGVVIAVTGVTSGCEKTQKPSTDKSATLAPQPTPSTNTNKAAEFDFDKSIGWLHGTCLAIKNDHVPPETNVTLVVMGEPQSVIETQIQNTVTADSDCPPLQEEKAAINKKDKSFYSVKLPDPEADIMAIGIVGDHPNVTITDNRAEADLDKDGVNEVFTSCATSEGIKFFVWSGVANKDSPRWSGYYYLGYDMEPTCPDAK